MAAPESDASKRQNYRLKIAYHGKPYHGWQRQPGKVTVQAELEAAAEALYGEPVAMAASGRTDTGVHALGQVVSFQAPAKHGPLTIRQALNAKLDATIRVLEARRAPGDFHARFSATGKTYCYRILNAAVEDPFRLDVRWFVPRPLDVSAMRRAARHLVGEHDFASFASNPGYARETTVRHVRWLRLARRGDEITLRVHADGFLYKMVRNLAGTLVKVGSGRLAPEELLAIRETRARRAAPPSAPAHGLFLESVQYEGTTPARRFDPAKAAAKRRRAKR
ncbi:MAG: tRNA pseudouridine(38-40) synthase TruA [Verrucomicrobiota bacterium]